MAAPTITDLTAITTEGLKRAGYDSPSSAQLTRAQTYWVREIKSDIARNLKKPMTLQVSSALVTTNGKSRYSNPTDYARDMTITLIYGSVIGTAQTGSSSSVTLASGHGQSETSLMGKEIFIYSETGVSSLSQCTGLSGDIASVIPNWATAPANGSKYMIIDRYVPLESKAAWDMDKYSSPAVGEPCEYHMSGDADYGEFELYPTPYNTTAPYGLKMRYHADLKTLDTASTALSTFYQKHETLFIQGVYYRALQDMNDDREFEAKQEYQRLLFEVVARETYGVDLSNLSCQVSGY